MINTSSRSGPNNILQNSPVLFLNSIYLRVEYTTKEDWLPYIET